MGIRDDAEDLGVPSGLPVEPESEPPYDPATDPTQIEVRVLQWARYDGFPIRDGYKSHYRPRTEEDGDALFVIINTPPQMPAPEKAELPSWGETGRVDPKFVAKYAKHERGWNHWSLGRNQGVLRWWMKEGEQE